MKALAFLTVAVMLLSPFLFAADCPIQISYDGWGYDCVFYGGDFDPNDPNANGLANENDAIVSGTPYGAATYQNFVTNFPYPIGGLFTSNLSGLNPQSAYWEIRSGMSEGNGGTLIASGTASGTEFLHTPTGRSAFGYDEYIDAALGFAVILEPGTYWFAVVPNDPSGASRSFNTNTLGSNSIGTQISDAQYFNSSFFGANFTNANNDGVFHTFSSGALYIWLPEPSSAILLVSGLMAAAAVARRRIVG